MDAVRDRISRLVARELDLTEDRIVETASLEADLSATSTDLVELVMSVEDEFRIDISDDEASHLKTVGDLVAFVEKKVRAEQNGPA